MKLAFYKIMRLSKLLSIYLNYILVMSVKISIYEPKVLISFCCFSVKLCIFHSRHWKPVLSIAMISSTVPKTITWTDTHLLPEIFWVSTQMSNYVFIMSIISYEIFKMLINKQWAKCKYEEMYKNTSVCPFKND